MSMNWSSRCGLVFCVVVGLATSGCAAGSWGRLVGKRSDEAPLRVTLAWAKMKEDEGRLTEARDGYEKVLAQEPQNVDAVLGMSRLNVKAQRLVEAQQGFDLALELLPKSAVVLREVGNFYSIQQRWDKAIPLLQEAQRIEPHEKSHHFNLAVALTKADRVDEALPHFTEAVGAAAAHYNIGRMLVETGKTAAAEQQFTLALAKDPKLTDAQFFLDEIKSKGAHDGESGIIVAQPVTNAPATAPATASATAPATQQVSGSSPAGSRPVVTPAGNERRQVRPAEYPHGGYEELPPPDTIKGAQFTPAINGRVTSPITQTGYSPVATAPARPGQPNPLPRRKLLPAPTAQGSQVRVSATTQFPLGQ